MTQPLPSGTVTLLLTDIESSVRHWERDPSAMADAVELHEHLLASAIQSCGGHLIKSQGEGDSTFSAFELASNAICAAIAAQRALAEVDWPTEQPVRVRMAIHSGIVEPRDGDYFGPVPIRAARLREAGHGGQLLVSGVIARLAQRNLPPELRLTALGRHRLRDLGEAEEIYQVDDSLRPEAFPALKSIDAWPNNLPTLQSSFIGREAEQAAVGEALARSRLVTLAGPPGVGKTRLALQVGAHLLHEYPDGVWFLELAAVQDLAALSSMLATRLGIRTEGDALAAVVAHARTRRMLLLLDNCEHVLVPSAHAIRRILEAGDGVTVLATSRRQLALDVERLFEVHPLPLPAKEAAGLAGLESEAVQLFAARANAWSGLTLTDATAVHVANVCRSVDGIPLAIEMAAAWTRVLGVRQIADRLRSGEFSPRWLADDPDATYETFDAAIQWSWELLSPAEQTLCMQLAVFEGGARLQSIESMAERDCLEDLAALVGQSLVQRYEDAAGHSRYRMHALVRDFAVDRLVAAGLEDTTRDRHARLFLELAETASAALRTPAMTEWLARLDDEQANIQTALRRFMATDQGDEALRLASSMWFYYYLRGSFAEGREMVERALAMRSPETSKEVQAKALHAAGTLAAVGGATTLARSHLEPAAAIWRELGDNVGLANTTNNLAIAAERDHDYRGAAELYEEALKLRTGSGDVRGSVTTLTNLAQTRVLVAELDQAEDAVRAAMALVEQSGDDRQLGDFLLRQAVIEIDKAQFEAAERTIARCCVIAERLDHRVLLAAAEMERGRLWLNTGQFEPAATHLLRSLRLWKQQRNESETATVLRHLADIAFFRGNLEGARRRYRSALGRITAGENLWLQSTLVDGLCRVAMDSGQFELARGLLAEAFDQRQALGCPLPLIRSIESVALLLATQGDAAPAANLALQAEGLRAMIGIPRPPVLRDHLARRIQAPPETEKRPSIDRPDWTWSGIALDDVVASARRHV